MRVLVRYESSVITPVCVIVYAKKEEFSMSGNNKIYCSRIFYPSGLAQRNFKVSFEPALREAVLKGNRPVILMDMQVGREELVTPFVLSENCKNFCLSSVGFTFFVREAKTNYDSVPMYEVYIDNRWAWVDKPGNQGFALLMKEYTTMRYVRQG